MIVERQGPAAPQDLLGDVSPTAEVSRMGYSSELNPMFEDPALSRFLDKRRKQTEDMAGLMPAALASIKPAVQSSTFTSTHHNTRTHELNTTSSNDTDSDSRPRLPPSHDLFELITDAHEQIPSSTELAKAETSQSPRQAQNAAEMDSPTGDDPPPVLYSQQSVAGGRSPFVRPHLRNHAARSTQPGSTSTLGAAILAAESGARSTPQTVPATQQRPSYQLNGPIPLASITDAPVRSQVAREHTNYNVPRMRSVPQPGTSSADSMAASTRGRTTATASIPISRSSNAGRADAWQPASFGAAWVDRQAPAHPPPTQPLPPLPRRDEGLPTSPTLPSGDRRKKRRINKKKKQHKDRSVSNSGHNSVVSQSLRSSSAALRAFHNAQLQSGTTTSHSTGRVVTASASIIIPDPVHNGVNTAEELSRAMCTATLCYPSTDSSSSNGWDAADRGVRNFVDPLAPWNKGVAVFPAHHHYNGPIRTLDQNAKFITEWMDKSEKEMGGMSMLVDFDEYRVWMASSLSVRRELDFDEEHWARTIVPEYWKPLAFGTESQTLFWQGHMICQNPPPLDPNDLVDARPFWVLHPTHHGVFHKADVFGIDNGRNPCEPAALQEARDFDRGSSWFAQTYITNNPHRFANRSDIEGPGRPVSSASSHGHTIPRVPLIIRLAQRQDMYQISCILNRYINKISTLLVEDECTEEDMKLKWQVCKENGLPFLVACQPHAHGTDSSPRTCRRSQFLEEKVLGFAVATDRYIQGNLDLDNKGVQVFVESKSIGLRIGSCLLDKMLKLINPMHREKTRCDMDLHDDESATPPSSAGIPVKNVFMECLWDADDSAHANRLRTWLCVRQGWDYCGRSARIGYKKEKPVDMYTYKYSFYGD